MVEACEDRANFLHLRPQQAAILGIEPDHFDCYDSLPQLEHAFRRFAESIASAVPRSTARLRVHLPGDSRIGVPRRVVRLVGRRRLVGQDYRGKLRAIRLEIRRFGRRLCEVRLPTPGEHNVLNALAAAVLAYENGLSPGQISAGLGSFPGLHRRLERLGTWRGVAFIDDYAHHPTEVTAALATVRRMAPHARVWCIFQPHQASRTARLLDGLAASLQNADKVLVAEIFRGTGGRSPTGGGYGSPISPGGRRSLASRFCRDTPRERLSKRSKPSWPPATYWLR